jgi:hypothetical protein
MITTGSKFFYALAGLLVLAAIVYGYSTGGDNVGPLSLGYKGSIGDVVGYTLLIGAAVASAFLGFTTTAFRDADPEAGADLLGTDAPPVPTAPATSYWPVVGAFGAALAVIGVVLNNVFFVAGLIVLGAVALEWTMQAWADRATGGPAVNREIRNRVMLPLEVPVAGALIVGVVIVGYSRVFLAVSAANAVWVALGVAALIFFVGTALAAQPRIRTDLIAGLLVVGAVVTIGVGIVAAVSGERDFEHHEPGHAEEGEHSEDEGNPEDSQEPAEEEGAALEESN